MNKPLLSIFIVGLLTTLLYSEANKSIEINQTKSQLELQKQIKLEKEYAKTGEFKKGKDYNLSYAEVNTSTLDNVPTLVPDYEFDMDDVYD
ncbi:MAG: hypothetical protein U9N49_04355 [Campylobacterota bacterium]|nr:hypothetical protein [Campylobacterota bacterium]